MEELEFRFVINVHRFVFPINRLLMQRIFKSLSEMVQ
jgi:hypothetical protein